MTDIERMRMQGQIEALTFTVSALAGALHVAGIVNADDLAGLMRSAATNPPAQGALNTMADGIAGGVERQERLRDAPTRGGLRVIDGGGEPE